MSKFKPVLIPVAAFAFCRYSIAILVWLALILQIRWLVLVVFLILLFSAILKIKRAPMIVLYSYTINKVIKSKDAIVNENAMRFAHIMGSTLSFICLLFLYLINAYIGWWVVFGFAILKTISAVGFCPASKLYECMGNDSCCVFAKKLMKNKK